MYLFLLLTILSFLSYFLLFPIFDKFEIVEHFVLVSGSHRTLYFLLLAHLVSQNRQEYYY